MVLLNLIPMFKVIYQVTYLQIKENFQLYKEAKKLLNESAIYNAKDFDTSKFPVKLPAEIMKKLSVKGLEFNVEMNNLNEIIEFYANKGVNYIQVGGHGLFLIGEDVLGLGEIRAPRLRGKGTIRVRMQSQGASGKPPLELAA